jgi:hypothetical protein
MPIHAVAARELDVSDGNQTGTRGLVEFEQLVCWLSSSWR